MRMKIHALDWENLCHFSDIALHLQRVKNSKSVRKQKPVNLGALERPRKFENIIRGVIHSVAPVFHVKIALYTKRAGVFDDFERVGKMLLRGFAKLRRAVLFRTLCKKVDAFAAGIICPVNALAVYESENFDPLKKPLFFCPRGD